MIHQGFIPVENGHLYFETVGRGDPILFIHGFSLDHRMWQPQIEYFENKYQTISYDMRGFGQSSMPTGQYSHHEDMKTLIDKLELEFVHLVGLSLGGEMAIDFSIMCPGRVRTLTLIDSSMGGFPSKVDWNVHAKEQGLDRAKQNWLNHDVFKPSCRNETVKQLLIQYVNDYSGWHWLHHDPRIKVKPSALERLGEITAPTQIIVGADDLDNYHQIAKVIHERVKKSKVEVLLNTGHMGNLEKIDLINNLIELSLKTYHESG